MNNSHSCQLCGGYFHALCSPEQLKRKTCGRVQCGGEDLESAFALLDQAKLEFAVELTRSVNSVQVSAAATAQSLGYISDVVLHKLGCKAAGLTAESYTDAKLLAWAREYTQANAEKASHAPYTSPGEKQSTLRADLDARSSRSHGLMKAMSLPKQSAQDRAYCADMHTLD